MAEILTSMDEGGLIILVLKKLNILKIRKNRQKPDSLNMTNYCKILLYAVFTIIFRNLKKNQNNRRITEN